MSNHSHLHEIESGGKVLSVDAFGTREECDHCREKAGLPLMAEVAVIAARASAQAAGGRAPTDELEAELARAEAENDDLRTQLRNATPAIAAERDKALAELGAVRRQLTALEKQNEQIPELERLLQAEREKSASLEQSLAAKKK
jgi:chromosome segregation ATPase